MDKMTFYGLFFVTFVPTISVAMSNSGDIDYFQPLSSHCCLISSCCEQLFPGVSQGMYTQSELIGLGEQKKLLFSRYKVTNQPTMNENLQEESNYEDSSKNNPTDEKRVLLDRAAKVIAGAKIKSIIEIPAKKELSVVRKKKRKKIRLGSYRCRYSGCHRAFVRQGSLSNHERIHTGEGIHRCLYRRCGKKFTNRGHYIIHKRSHKRNSS